MAKGSSIDFSKFKKQSSDGKTVTLRHPHGHSITVALGPLSPKMRKQFEDLPSHNAEKPHYDDGGGVQPYDPLNPPVAEQAQDNPQQIADVSSANQPSSEYQQFLAKEQANGGGQGGGLAGTSSPQAAAQRDLDQYNQLSTTPEGQRSASNDASLRSLEDTAHPKQAPEAKETPQPKAGAKEVPPPDIPKDLNPGNGQQQNTGPLGGGMMDAYFNNLRNANAMGMRGINEQQAAQTGLGNSKAEIYGNQAGATQQNMDMSQAVNEASMRERENFVHDIKNGHINPNHYLESMDKGEKVMTGLGIILGGGFGAVLGTNGSAYDWLQKQIDRDISAQDRNLHSDENLLNNNLEHFKNLQVAQEFRRVQMNDLYGQMIDTAKAQNMGPQAQANADSLKADLMQKNAMTMAQMGHGMSGSPEEFLDFKRRTGAPDLKQWQEAYVQGHGFSRQPVPEDTRKKLTAMTDFDNALTDYQSFIAQNHGSLNKSLAGKFSPKIAAQADVKQRTLQALAREGLLNTVYREGEQPLLDQLVGKPNNVFAGYTVSPGITELQKMNKMRLQNQLYQAGFPVPAQAAAPAAPARKLGFSPRQR